MALFFKSKKKEPKEVVRGIKRKINRDVRDLERQIAGITREEKKVTAEIKKLAKKNVHAFLGIRIFGPTKNGPNFLNAYPIQIESWQLLII